MNSPSPVSFSAAGCETLATYLIVFTPAPVLLTVPALRTGTVIAHLDLKKPPRDNPPRPRPGSAGEPREELAEGRVTVGKFLATSLPFL